jgi:signal transduction histidine kinase
VTALKEVGDRLTAGEAAAFEFRLSGRPRRVETRTEENLLRIGQEAVINALRHADPSTIRVELRYGPDALLLRVSDDGQGFDWANRATDDHWGLTSMQERAEQIGGTFRLDSKIGGGTVIEIEVPLKPSSGASTDRYRRAS